MVKKFSINEDVTEIDITDLPSGLYLVKLISEVRSIIKPLQIIKP